MYSNSPNRYAYSMLDVLRFLELLLYGVVCLKQFDYFCIVLGLLTSFLNK